MGPLQQVARPSIGRKAIKRFIPVLLVLSGCEGPSPPQETTGCQHPVGVRGRFAEHMTVTLRGGRDFEEATKRLAAKYQFEARESSSDGHRFHINVDAMTEQAARALAEQLRREPDVEVIEFLSRVINGPAPQPAGK